MGKPTRITEYLPGRRDWMPHHHRHARSTEETLPGRQRPSRVLARNGPHVLQRRAKGRILAVVHVMKRRAVFLDRDGVLNSAIVRNGRPHSPSGLDEVEVPAGIP